MNHERLKALARNSAVIMLDRDLTVNQIIDGVNTPEINLLDSDEHRAYTRYLTDFLRELSREIVDEGKNTV